MLCCSERIIPMAGSCANEIFRDGGYSTKFWDKILRCFCSKLADLSHTASAIKMDVRPRPALPAEKYIPHTGYSEWMDLKMQVYMCFGLYTNVIWDCNPWYPPITCSHISPQTLGNCKHPHHGLIFIIPNHTVYPFVHFWNIHKNSTERAWIYERIYWWWFKWTQSTNWTRQKNHHSEVTFSNTRLFPWNSNQH